MVIFITNVVNKVGLYDKYLGLPMHRGNQEYPTYLTRLDDPKTYWRINFFKKYLTLGRVPDPS